MIYSIAFIGKNNEPLYCCSEIDIVDESLYLQTVAHSSLDIIEERRKKFSTSAPGTQDLYLGHLFSISDYKSFGLCSNTFIKVIAVCDTATPESGYIRDLIFGLYSLYTIAIQSPFHEPGAAVKSKLFATNVQQMVQRFNNSGPITTPNKK